MMPNAVKRFPRSYSGGQSPSHTGPKTLTGDETVAALWVDYTAPAAMTDTWTFRRRVLKVAMEQFDTRTNWFTSQDSNGYLIGYDFDFIYDTLNFIKTGRRRLSVHTWPDLVSSEVGEEVDVEHRHTLTDFIGSSGIATSAVGMIQQWCSHPGGIDDMVCTLNILFGDLTVKAESTL